MKKKNKSMFMQCIITVVIMNLYTPGHSLFGMYNVTSLLTLNSENVKEGVKVTAVLKDSKGIPIPDAPLYFSTMTTFGSLKLKSLPTGDDGSATLLIPGNDRKGDFTIEVNFKGDGNNGPVYQKANIKFGEYRQKETSFLRLPLPFFVSFSQLMNKLFPKESEILLYSGDSGEFASAEVPSGTSVTPYPSLELVSILFVIFATIWSIYFYIVNQILKIKSVYL